MTCFSDHAGNVMTYSNPSFIDTTSINGFVLKSFTPAKIRAASVLQRDALLLMKAEFLFKTGVSTFCQLGILFTYSFKKKQPM